MRAHVIENGVVVNTIEVESLDFMPGLVDAAIGGSVGDLWDGHIFTKPPPEIPQSVPMVAAHVALIKAGYIAAVEAYIAAIPGQDGEIARAYWQRSQTLDRNNPLVLAAIAAKVMTADQVDQLMIAAAK
jgi:hypothetical protein